MKNLLKCLWYFKKLYIFKTNAGQTCSTIVSLLQKRIILCVIASVATSPFVLLFMTPPATMCFVLNVGIHSFSSVAAYRQRLQFTVPSQLRQTHCVACKDYLQTQEALETLPNKIPITHTAPCSSGTVATRKCSYMSNWALGHVVTTDINLSRSLAVALNN